MGEITFTIPGQLPSLNEYTRACRGSKFAGAGMKKDAEEIVCMSANMLKGIGIQTPVHITFRWIEPNERKDTDNVAFAKKFILDALVSIEALKGDGRRYVKGFTDVFPEPDKQNPRIEVVIEEAGRLNDT